MDFLMGDFLVIFSAVTTGLFGGNAQHRSPAFGDR
jgi:hypothetical protein